MGRPDGKSHLGSAAKRVKSPAPANDSRFLDHSLGEYLDLLELRGLNWHVAAISTDCGYKVVGGELLNFYLLMDGRVRMTTASGQSATMTSGDAIFVMPGETLRIGPESFRRAFSPPVSDEGQAGGNITVAQLGDGPPVARLLCGRLEARWPGGVYPVRAPKRLSIRSDSCGIDPVSLLQAANGLCHGVLLDQLAKFLFVMAFRDNPRCRAQFRWDLSDPIARAQVLIAKHPFRKWNVNLLASAVGMGRSNFAARFARQTGSTPMEALMRERMTQTGILLKDSRLKIGEICERVGYRSEAAFIRRFTAQFGMTPSKWRRTHRAS